MFQIPFLGGIHITEAETLAKEIKFENEANGQMSLGRDSDISRYGKRCRGVFSKKIWKAKLSLKMGMQMEGIFNIFNPLNGWRKMMEVFARLTRKNFFEKNKSIQKLYATFLETCDWKIIKSTRFFLCKKTHTTSRHQLSRCQGFIVWWVTWMVGFFHGSRDRGFHPMKVWFIIGHTPGNPITFFHSFSVGKKWSFPVFWQPLRDDSVKISGFHLYLRICHPFWGRD